MMWRYYELLTDVRVEQIAAMKSDAASGKAHPMALKKELARSIVADFHSAEAATKAGEDWARQFQRDEVPTGADCVVVDVEKIRIKSVRDLSDESSYFPLHKFQTGAAAKCSKDELRLVGVDRLLFEAGLLSSRTEAGRKIREKAVHVDGHGVTTLVMLVCPKEPLIVRVGKKIKKVVLTGP
jgi:tyrosyl-tRNA synthetase